MTVTPEERDAMANILRAMNGEAPITPVKNSNVTNSVELAGPGAVTNADINAMADVLNKLNSVSNDVVKEMVVESEYNPSVDMALNTSKNEDGVKVGRYQILIKEDDKRLAGKQYYSIYNTRTNDIIADDLSLYETALTVVKLLNGGKYTNSPDVLKLFDYDNTYTAHKQDAIRFKRAMIVAERKNDYSKYELYESRQQASLDRAMAAKKNIKSFKSGQ
jgi:hypothetical protein